MSNNKSKFIDPEYYRDSLEKLTELLGIEKDYWQCFLESITHSTFIEEKKPSWNCNERVEFLGDSVIDLTISDFLYREYPEENEGFLTIQRANLVSTESFADLSRKLGFGKFLLLGKGEENSGGADKNSVLADLYESIIGMVFICKGFEFTSNLILSHFKEKLQDISVIKKPAKSLLQEVSQKNLKQSPVYHIINETGKIHKNFFAEVSLNGHVVGHGVGLTKKEAETLAAQEALEYIDKYPVKDLVK